MNLRVPFVFYALINLLVPPVLAQPTEFHHLTPNDGMAQSTVAQITQDSLGFMWFATPKGLSRYDSREFKNYVYDPLKEGSLSSNNVRSVFCDSRGVLWVGTENGLNRYNSVTDSFEVLSSDVSDLNSLSNKSIRSFEEDHLGNLWVGTADGLNKLYYRDGRMQITRYLMSGDFGGKEGITIYDLHIDQAGILWAATSDGLAKIQPGGGKVEMIRDKLVDKRVRAVHSDHSGNLWIGTIQGGLSCLNLHTGQISNYPGPPNIKGEKFLSIFRILTDRTGRIWVGTEKGLYSFTNEDRRFIIYRHNPTDHKSFGSNSINYIFEDKQGLLWFGTYDDGVDYLYPDNQPFSRMEIGESSVNSVLNVVEDFNQDLWISISEKRVAMLNSKNEIDHYLRLDPSRKEKIRSLYADSENTLWIGEDHNKLIGYNIQSKTFKEYSFGIEKKTLQEPQHHYITSILKDSEGRLWIGTSREGLYLLNLEDDSFKQVQLNRNGLRFVSFIYEDSSNNIWIGADNGIVLLFSGEGKPEWIQVVRNSDESDVGAPISIYEDKKGRIWIGTFYNGLIRYDPKQRKIFAYNNIKPLEGSYVGEILSDSHGYLWLGLDVSLVRFSPDFGTVQEYKTRDGLPGNGILKGAALYRQNGEMVFGSNHGVFKFVPGEIYLNKTPPNVVFTGLRLFNKPVQINDSTGLLRSELAQAHKIEFHHDQSIFTINFTVLNFLRPEKNLYAYKLDGFEKEWNYVNTPSATYTNLPSGEYTFLVKGANNDGIWSSNVTRLKISILAPWWRTWYAYVTYLLLFTTLSYFLIRFFWWKNLLTKEKELQQLKLDFFTNISHEIRTHLTLINGPVESMLLSTKREEEKNKLHVVKSNSDRLLHLVNELMDFRKMESGIGRLAVSEYDVVPFVRETLSAFKHLSQSKGINTTFSANKQSIMLWFDPGQLQKVIYNLLMNAYKFTPDGQDVSVVIEQHSEFVKIIVTDNGIGIAPNYLDKLFDNYFQVYDFGKHNTGYGIGLAMSKGIVNSLKGTLEVKSRLAEEGKNGYTTFTIMLLNGNAHFQPTDISSSKNSFVLSDTSDFSEPSELTPGYAEDIIKYSILLVEDNKELLAFLTESLRGQYNVIQANDGDTGWDLASNDIPDLVISDVMMEKMNGLQLCQKIKADMRTSHIPVILLTAKAAPLQQIDGLKSGADLYVTKPFSIQSLQLQIGNIFRTRENMHAKYSLQVDLNNKRVGISDREQAFLNKIIQYVEENMEDKSIGVIELSSYIGMSKSALYRKLRALTNMTINDFIKVVRLKRAASLLAEKDLTVSEISFMVGYDDRKYFSQEFKKQYGKTPSEYSAAIT